MTDLHDLSLEQVCGVLGAVRPEEPLAQWYRQQPEATPLPDGPSLESDEVIKPSERELQRNSRSRQGLLHILHKRSLPRLGQLEKRAYRLPGWTKIAAPVDSAGAAAGAAEADAPKAKLKRSRED